MDEDVNCLDVTDDGPAPGEEAASGCGRSWRFVGGLEDTMISLSIRWMHQGQSDGNVNIRSLGCLLPFELSEFVCKIKRSSLSLNAQWALVWVALCVAHAGESQYWYSAVQ